jgi:hypothetical protein
MHGECIMQSTCFPEMSRCHNCRGVGVCPGVYFLTRINPKFWEHKVVPVTHWMPCTFLGLRHPECLMRRYTSRGSGGNTLGRSTQNAPSGWQPHCVCGSGTPWCRRQCIAGDPHAHRLAGKGPWWWRGGSCRGGRGAGGCSGADIGLLARPRRTASESSAIPWLQSND